ncbi:MFS transporter [Jatrophihabitans telluris]|uniref:MFS transporter n=1 Tax=Jatrophihabitans telluris TaxID=2038343 RepID=A0ABY4QV55_9ACTN|nr:MFS transporter [Jatrophihabitans telluris]UQX87164.1 MFS transporter [Jatrophihabitans telluris]
MTSEITADGTTESNQIGERDREGDRPAAKHANLALFALAIGGFAIGTGEFVSMGLLPNIAAGVNISIPQAGHVISAYAIGVMVGAPLIAAFAAKWPRKRLLWVLMAAFVLGNLASAVAPNYPTLLLARFFSGLPHGAFFGIGAVVGASLVAPTRRAWAVSMMMSGLTVANVVGVPATTYLGQVLSWRWPYAAVGILAMLTLAAVLFWVPGRPPEADATIGSELSALRQRQVWLALLVGTVGFGGMFATYSYITPTMTTLAGFSETAVTGLLAVYGVGMTIGVIIGGRLADRALMPSLYGGLVLSAIVLFGFGVVVHTKPGAVLAVLVLGLSGSLLIPILQTRLMDVAREGQSLAAALNHSTLNLANALGAWLGGVVLDAGLGYEWPSRVGGFLALAGLAVALVSGRLDRQAADRVTATEGARARRGVG